MGQVDVYTIAIIAINAIVSMAGFNKPGFLDEYKFNVGAIQRGEYIRAVSSGFLHVDFSHLLVNMLTLYFFAPALVSELGGERFLAIYIFSLLAANLLSFYFNRDKPWYSAVGASGAVTGVLFSYILLNPDAVLQLYFLIPIPAYVFGIGYLFYSIYGMRARNDNIGHDAHFGGAIGGYLLTLFLIPTLVKTSTTMVLLLLVPIVALFLLKRLGKLP